MKKGYSLAEIFIAMMILGVITAMTIPSLMQSAKNRDNVSRLKKLASGLAVATNFLQIQDGPLDSWNWAVENDIIELYKTQMKTLKECGTSSGCFSPNPKGLNGSPLPDYDTDNNYHKVILADGSMVALTSCSKGGCSPAEYGLEPTSNLLGGFVVDVNGLRAPNQGGKDIFYFGLVENKGLQAGGTYSSNGCTSNGSSNGLNCTAKVIKEGKINHW